MSVTGTKRAGIWPFSEVKWRKALFIAEDTVFSTGSNRKNVFIWWHMEFSIPLGNDRARKLRNFVYIDIIQRLHSFPRDQLNMLVFQTKESWRHVHYSMVSSAIRKKNMHEWVKVTSVCFSTLDEKPYYNILLTYTKKLRRSKLAFLTKV